MAVALFKLAGAFVLSLLIYGGVEVAGHHIEYWLAGLIALVVVFGGFLIIDGDWIT
jgi:hypothetical protein